MTMPSKFRLPLALALVGLFFLAAPGLGGGAAHADGPKLPKPQGKLIATWETAGGGGALSEPGTLNPAGAVVCLVHEPELTLDPLAVPFPNAILSEARIGCETLILENKGGKKKDDVVLQYGASNGGFAKFAANITNGTDELLQMYVQLVDASMLANGPAYFGADMESTITAQRVKRHSVAVPDLQGYNLEAIRLRVKKFEMTTSATGDYVGYVFETKWEFYGKKVKNRPVASLESGSHDSDDDD